MGGKKSVVMLLCVLLCCGLAGANWRETFEGDPFDLDTWVFPSYPDSATYTAEVKEGQESNHYLELAESKAADAGGAAFGTGFGGEEVFTDVRVGAVVNATGDTDGNYHGLAARAQYVMAGGIVASGYVMHIDWDNGPAEFAINVEKVVQLQNMMREGFALRVPGYAHRRSYYAQLDVVGSGPVYVTGRLYEYEGGPLVAQLPTMVDTAGLDWWEDPDVQDAPFLSGSSGVFAQNESASPPGFVTSFDDVSSVSDGPAAVGPVPTDDSADVALSPSLAWTQGEFAESVEVWLGPAGAMQRIYVGAGGEPIGPGMLRAGETYQWRVDQIGPGGTVAGDVWTFSTVDSVGVEDFEGYAGDGALHSAWDPNMPGQPAGDPNSINFIDTEVVAEGTQAMRLEYCNLEEPFHREFGRMLEPAQNWTVDGLAYLVLAFRGVEENVEQPLYIRIEDAAGNPGTMDLGAPYALKSEQWHDWRIALAEFASQGVDLAAVAKLVIGVGGDSASSQPGGDIDILYVDNIRLEQTPCGLSEADQLRDFNSDCTVNLADFAFFAQAWMQTGSE